MNKLSVEQIENWIKEISEVNIEKGWRKEGLEICDFTSNLHGEISEAFEDYRNNKGINEVWYEYNDGIVSEKKQLPESELYMFGNLKKEILGKPCGIPSELSDIVIRALDMIGYYGLESYYMEEFEIKISENKLEILINNKFTKNISELHNIVSSMSSGEHLVAKVDYLIKHCFVIANENEIDLIEQINDKIAYNRTRPSRHGGKRV